MPVIRSDGHLSDGAGNHADHAFSYVSYERVLAAMEHLRDLSGPFGYYHRTAFGRETYNLGLNGHGKSPRRRAQGAPTGLAQSVRLATLDAPSPAPGRATTLLEVPTRAADEGPVPYPLTDATGATLNGIAKALAAEPIDSPEACVPQLTDGWLPLKFADLWRARSRDAAEIDGDEAEETWGQGAAGAVQTFNLGDQVDPLQMLRGDVLQQGAWPTSP